MVSLLTQWCQWHHWVLTQRCQLHCSVLTQQCQLHLWVLTQQCHGARSYTKIDFQWLSGVSDTAQFLLSGAIDTAESGLSGVIGDLKLKYLGKLTIFFATILGCESEAQGEMFDEKKTQRSKISWDCPFKLNATAVTVTAWNKYLSTVKKFIQCCHRFALTVKWPPEEDHVLYGFVLWCLDEEKLHPDTVKAYLSHGFPPIPVAKSPTLPFILSRAKNKHVAKHPAKKRHPITYRHLQRIRQYITGSKCSKYNKILC